MRDGGILSELSTPSYMKKHQKTPKVILCQLIHLILVMYVLKRNCNFILVWICIFPIAGKEYKMVKWMVMVMVMVMVDGEVDGGEC